MRDASCDLYLAKLGQWLAEQGNRMGEVPPADADLFEAGYIDSLGLIRLILFVETLRGAPVEGDLMRPQNFDSLHRIVQTFFTDATMPVGSACHA